MGDKTPVARRSMVGAPPASRPARTPKASATPRNVAATKKKGAKDVEDIKSEDRSEENSDGESAGSPSEDTDSLTQPQRKKRRKKLTDYTMKRKAREAARAKAAELRKRQIEAGILDEEEPEATPEPEDEPEPESKPPKIREYSPFQLLCDHLLRKLMAKDPEEYFAFPVTLSMAPDYHDVITTPMDFSAIRQKIEDDLYENLPQMRGDAELIVSNALAYNHPNTVYHLAATRLAHIVRFYFAEQHLRYLFHMMPRAREIPLEKIGLTPLAPRLTARVNKRREALHDPYDGKELLKSIPEPQSTRLSTRVPVLKNAHLAFLDNKDGATALKIVTNSGNSDKKEPRLVDVVGALEEGTPGMFMPIESRNSQGSLTYLDYGPYSSFAPHYDSTWATLNKDESDLFLRTYGDRENVTEAISLRKMVADAGAPMLLAVDEFLDTLTDGEHSRSIQTLENRVSKSDDADLYALLNEVESIGNIGLDTSVIAEIRNRLNPEQATSLQQQLDSQGRMVVDLMNMQRGRLSQIPPIALTKVAGPGPIEGQLANKLSSRLANTINTFVQPGGLVTAPVLHHAMGIEEADDDIMSEFFVND